MNSFASWGLTILGLATVTTVAEMLLPKGRMRNVIRSVFATVTVIAIVTPLPSLFKTGFSFDFENTAVDVQDGYIDYIDASRGELISSATEQYLNDNGYSGVTVSVETDGYNVSSAAVKFDEIGITGNDGHINKSEIKRLVAEFLHIGEEAVMTYG